MNTHDIELPPLPRPQVPRIDADLDLMDIRRLADWCEKTAKEYARAAIEADRKLLKGVNSTHTLGEPVAYLQAENLVRLAQPHVAGCAASIQKEPADGFIPIFTAPQPAEPVAYLDLGVGGYIDVGTDLTDEQLAALPKGRYMLGIIGACGVDGYREVDPQPAKPVKVPSDVRGDVARELQEANRHLEMPTARYYVDAVCDLLARYGHIAQHPINPNQGKE